MTKFNELQFKDDFMFGAVLSNPEICKGILELILKVKIDKIKYIERQKTIDVAPFSKGIRLDVYVDDENKTVYSVEMQRKHIKGLSKRVRYYQSINDISLLEEGGDYDKLKRSIIIFFCDFDPFYEKMYQYTFENRCIEKLDLKLDDETVKIFLNTKGQKGNISQELKDLLAYIGDAQNMFKEPLIMKIDEEIKRVRVDPESRRDFMLLEVKLNETRVEGEKRGEKRGIAIGKSEGIAIGKADGIAIGKANGIAIGEAKGKADGIAIGQTKIVKTLLETMSVSEVSKVTKLTEEEVQKIQEEKN